MGRKIGKFGLTENNVLYLSEETNEQDLARAEKLKADKPKEFEDRKKELLQTTGWKH